MISREQTINFLQTLKLTLRKWLRGEQAIAEYEDIKVRRDICRSCEFFQQKRGLPHRCLACGCNVELKIMFITADCPEGKWGRLDY